MGVWATLKAALGLDPAPAVRDLDAPEVTPGAEARLAALPAGHGATLTLVPAPAGWLVQVDEGPVDAPHPGFDGLPIAATEAAFARLRGVALDHDGERWRVVAQVAVRARETPNPHGRLYLCDRPLSSGRLFYPKSSAAEAPWLARRLLERDDVASVLLRDHTVTLERTPDHPWEALDAAVGVAVREHVLSLGGVLDAAAAPLRRDALEAAVWEVLEQRVLPALHRDGGDLELIGVEDGVVRVHMVGACRTCPASVLTLKGGIERALREAFPGEIERVEAVG